MSVAQLAQTRLQHHSHLRGGTGRHSAPGRSLQASSVSSLFYVLADVCVGSARSQHRCSDPLYWHRRFSLAGKSAALQRMQNVTSMVCAC
jgi:hypothetical protein